jgi:hypothetical protein
MKTGQLYQKFSYLTSAGMLRNKPYRDVEKARSKVINNHKYGPILCPKSLQPYYNHKGHYLPIFKEAYSISVFISII